MKIKLLLSMLSLAMLVLISIISFARANTLLNPMHGYIDFPTSRAYLCSLGKNGNCGAVMVEPQSVEGRKGFPRRGPADGKIAIAGHRWFGELDEQTATRWTKVDVSPGKNTFHWMLTAPHRTTGWEYFITKQNWDPNTPLARSSFELQPFCSRTDGGQMPSFEVSIDCNVPYRTGYQVILGVWIIYDTGNAFYQVIDANMKP